MALGLVGSEDGLEGEGGKGGREREPFVRETSLPPYSLSEVRSSHPSSSGITSWECCLYCYYNARDREKDEIEQQRNEGTELENEKGREFYCRGQRERVLGTETER